MNQCELEFLQTREGAQWLERLRERPDDVHANMRWLRKSLSQGESGAVYELMRARKSLAGRHSQAERLFLDSKSASQASSEVVARWRARRFHGIDRVADLCCGAGIDTLSLALVAQVVAIDSDPMRLRFARINAQQLDLAVQFVQGIIPKCLSQIPFAFCDPDRRSRGARIVDPNEASPRLDQLLSMPNSQGMGVKLSPMANLDGLSDLGELEFISVNGEMKEIVLWTKSLARGERCVSLPALDLEHRVKPGLAPELGDSLGRYLIEPDPALIRSGLLGDLALQLGLKALARDIAYLTADEDPHNPLLRSRPILGWGKASQRVLQALISDHQIGRLDISRRGYPQSPEEIRKRLRLKGSAAGHLHLTRLGELRVGILVGPPDSSC